MATVGHYSVYAALLQTTVEGPEFADEPLYGSPKFLSGRFWPISIRKPDLGPDLVNFYPDARFGLIFFR